MNELRLDGRTAIVTGAGGNPSLGRAHALLLAARGANVVVNDIGRDPESFGYSDSASAAEVAEEIRARGGKAAADCHSVATEEGARSVIQSAIDAFGRVDILVNNAMVSAMAPFDVMKARDVHRQIEVDLLGVIWMCRAAWPYMRAQGYGRVVNISSGAFTGAALLSAYGAAKGGVFSLTRTLAAEGAPLGIKANTVVPGAFTRGVAATIKETSPMYGAMRDQLPAELVSPVVVYLAHDDCPVSGECIEAMGGSVRRIYLAQTRGIQDRALTVEKLAQRWAEIMADADATTIGHGTIDLTDHARPYPPASKPNG
jgi:NAD(P)-dependent dehydrogenase (short-subunit alcohol dehydrogenase family)